MTGCLGRPLQHENGGTPSRPPDRHRSCRFRSRRHAGRCVRDGHHGVGVALPSLVVRAMVSPVSSSRMRPKRLFTPRLWAVMACPAHTFIGAKGYDVKAVYNLVKAEDPVRENSHPQVGQAERLACRERLPNAFLRADAHTPCAAKGRKSEKDGWMRLRAGTLSSGQILLRYNKEKLALASRRKTVRAR